MSRLALASSRRKLLLLTGLALLFLAYVVSDEVLERYGALAEKYREIEEKSYQLLTPQDLAAKREALLQRKARIGKLIKGKEEIAQTEGGLAAYLAGAAREGSARLASLVPGKETRVGEIKALTLAAELQGSYHSLGRTLNLIETGSLPVRIRKLDIMSDATRKGILVAHFEAEALLLPETGQ